MSQSILLLFLLNFLFIFSLQTQLFREFAGSTNQNLEAQASQWTLSDPLGTEYPMSISECLTHKIAFKPDSLPPGTTLSKTLDGLEDHNLLRFYVQMYYMGDYTSQTVDIRFDGVVLETSKAVAPSLPSIYLTCSAPLVYTGQITYYGVVPHNTPSVTIEFSSNLHDSGLEVTWGLRNLSIVTDFSDTITDATISAFTFYQQPTIPRYPCKDFGFYVDDQGSCVNCNLPCQECYGPDSDQCFTYPPGSSQNRLCPAGQTFLSSGCTDCAVENCTLCDQDVNQCDTCLNTCAQCARISGTPQCQQCTFESNLVLYEGSCIDSCPLGTYADSNNKCQLCQPGCLDCTGPQDCITCDSAETTNIGGLCICNQPRMYFERDLGCIGNCFLGCEQCINGQECLICDSGMTVQPDGDCKCDINGFYYQDDTGSCTGQCFENCDYCHDSSSCLSCSGNRVPQGSTCICASPRVLIGPSCECPSFMNSNPWTPDCEGINLVDVVYQSTVSPLFDAIFQVRMNPITKYTSPPSITWMADNCPFQNFDTQNEFSNYLSTQNTDILFIPSKFLESQLQCSLSLFFAAGNNYFFFQVTFKALALSQPQVSIIGGPLQLLNHAEINFIFAQVQSSIGKPISPSDLKITWTQTSGDSLDMSSILDSSKPLQLTIPKCTLEKGKLYKFKLDVELLVNPGAAASQEVTIGAYAPKFQAQITQPTDNYHLSSNSLTLESQLSFQQDDECAQTSSLSDILDLSTAMYTWECFYLDLQLSSSRLLDESSDITNDPNVLSHPDPINIFYQSASSSTLTIPSSYFTDYPGYQFMFYLTVTVQNKDQTPSIESFTVLKPTLEILKTKIHLAIVNSKPFTTASFTCRSENNCQAYSNDFQTKFIGTSFDSQYSYKWALNTLQSISYTTFIRVFDNNGVGDWTVVARILYTITDGTNIASAFFTLPLNPSPQNGFINVYPIEGEAYNTKFFLSTYGWKDTDLPVSYQFYTSSYPYDDQHVKNYMIKTLNPFEFTPIVPWPNYNYFYVNVIAHDNLKSTAESSPAFVVLTDVPPTFCEAVEKGSQALTTSKKTDTLSQRFRLIRVILEMMPIWEQGFDSACMNDEYELKFTAVTQAREIVQALGSKEEFKVQLFNEIIWSSNPEYNQDQNWKLYTAIVDSDILPNKTLLPAEEYQLLLSFVDNQIYYMKKPNSTIEDPAKIFSYINILLKSTLYNALPVDIGVSYGGEFFTYWTYKTTYCKVLQESPYIIYGFHGLKPNVTLRPGQDFPPEKCNQLIDMVFLAFRSNYTVGSVGPNDYPQKLIYFDLIDSVTGKSLLDIFTFILLSPISICPIDASCNPTGEGGTEIYGIFDLRNQINKIFAKSNIDQIQNIAVLAHFEFWKSVAFWTVLAFSIGFLLSFYWLSVKHPTYCALTAHKAVAKEPLLKKINFFFWVIHPLVGIYVYNDVKTAKPVKLAIYYQRLVLVMVFSTIFSSLEKGEGWVFKGYILLFNTVTVTPVNAVLSRIFEWAFKINSGKKIVSRISLFIGVFFYLALLAACFLVMFIIEAQQDASQNKTWAVNFVIAFVQDLSLSPALTAINKVLLIKLSETERLSKTLTKSPRIISLIIPETFKSIYQRIFVSAPAPLQLNTKENAQDAGLSPRTTTMNPLSSNRQFLKFTTFDLPPQSTTQRNPLQTEFRTRFASENEIGSVDFAPMETLISNRFQTLFPEAKAEKIRPTSPTKQNFEKMQTSNIYSKGSLTNFPTFATTLKGSILKQSNAKPFQTIEFNAREPVEMTLDDIFQYAEQPDEDGGITNASQLKLFKKINTMESPIHKKKKHTPMSSYFPSAEVSLEQRVSEKNSKKKGILKQTETKPFQMIDLSSSNQIKGPAGFSPEEVSSFDGNIEETPGSQIKLSKNNSKAMESQVREKKRNTLAPSHFASGELSLEQRISEKNNTVMKKKDIGKPFQLMDLSPMNQPSELSSFDGNPEETFASQLKLLKNNSKTIESPIREKREDLTKSAPKITIGDFSSGDLPSMPKKKDFKLNETKTHKMEPSREVSSVLQFKEPAGFQFDEFSFFDENVEEAVVSLPKFKTVESTMNKRDKKEKAGKVENST